MRPTSRYLLPLALILSCVIGMSACSGTDWRRLDPKEVIDILPEYSLLSATLSQRDVADSVRQQAYREFFERKGLSLTDWDSTMAWYAKNRVKLYNDFYRLSIDSLSRVQNRLQAIEDRIQAIAQRRRDRISGLLDSVDLLGDTLEVYRSGEVINKHRILTPSTPYDSTTRVQLLARIIGLPELASDSLRLELRLHLNDTTSRTESLMIGRSGEYQLSANVPDGKTAKKVSALLRGLTPKLRKGHHLWVDRLRLIKNSDGQSNGDTKHLSSLPAEALELSEQSEETLIADDEL